MGLYATRKGANKMTFKLKAEHVQDIILINSYLASTGLKKQCLQLILKDRQILERIK